MTYFPDLSPYAYLSRPARDTYLPGVPELNVGWLDAGYDFPRGDMAPVLVEKLEGLCRGSPYNQTRGWHYCPFCSVGACGSAEIRIPGNGVVYAAPTLVGHYVAAHRYAPPAEFVEALRAGGGAARRPSAH
jgi:hypothetical protein